MNLSLDRDLNYQPRIALGFEWNRSLIIWSSWLAGLSENALISLQIHRSHSKLSPWSGFVKNMAPDFLWWHPGAKRHYCWKLKSTNHGTSGSFTTRPGQGAEQLVNVICIWHIHVHSICFDIYSNNLMLIYIPSPPYTLLSWHSLKTHKCIFYNDFPFVYLREGVKRPLAPHLLKIFICD